MGIKAIARMIQTMLYGKRFFPYYVHNILGGIEEDGECLVSQARLLLPESALAGSRTCRDALTYRYRGGVLV